VALCRELSGRDDSTALLERAERMNLFIVPLDLERRWYRFHHLFADYLRTQLDDAESVALHTRAAGYFEREDLMSEAIGHALEAGAIERAAGLIESAARSIYEAGELTTLLGWLAALPAERVAASVGLVSLQAYSAFYTGRVREAIEACERGEAARPEGAAPSSLLAVRALFAAFSNQPDAIALAQAAVEAVRDDRFYLAIALQALATSQQAAGRLEPTIQTASAALELVADADQSMIVVPAMTSLATALILTGRRGEAEALCRRTLTTFHREAAHMAGGTPYATYWLGMTRYEAGDLTEALHALERAWAAAGTFGFGRAMLTSAVWYLAFARHAKGSSDAALEAVRTVHRDCRAAGLEGVDLALGEIEARLFLLRGDLASAARWADRVRRDGAPGQPEHQQWYYFAPDLTAARVRIVQGRAREAADLLRRSRSSAEAAHDVADLISIAVLESVLADRTGDALRAQRLLEEAVGRAAPDGYVRRIVDDGHPVARLMPAVRRIAPAFVDEVMTALAGSARVRAAGPSRMSGTIWRDEQLEPVEALTARELEVLRLMSRGCGDADIAAELVVSLATAKWHAAHIRAKLGARNRTQALLRAQQLGLV
jgi:LuxR family maltose regulon positive regulatory protein